MKQKLEDLKQELAFVQQQISNNNNVHNELLKSKEYSAGFFDYCNGIINEVEYQTLKFKVKRIERKIKKS